VLGWAPDAFWAASMAELLSAYRGYLRARGIDPDSISTDQPMNRAEFEYLCKQMGVSYGTSA